MCYTVAVPPREPQRQQRMSVMTLKMATITYKLRSISEKHTWLREDWTYGYDGADDRLDHTSDGGDDGHDDPSDCRNY